MGFIEKDTLAVDAVLTNKGRDYLRKAVFGENQNGEHVITKFALADDEIDYTLYNESHPNGSQYYGEAIENMPLLEAIPDENNIMIHKLVTLPRGTTKLPIVTANVSKVQLSLGSTVNVNPTTLNFGGQANLKEPSGF